MGLEMLFEVHCTNSWVCILNKIQLKSKKKKSEGKRVIDTEFKVVKANSASSVRCRQNGFGKDIVLLKLCSQGPEDGEGTRNRVASQFSWEAWLVVGNQFCLKWNYFVMLLR